MIIFHKKIQPAKEYFEFKPCCGKMSQYRDLFLIGTSEVSIRNPELTSYGSYGIRSLPYSIEISYCPFCGVKFETES